uniref:Uncharacterized protein n=1 Tax=Avena sativa TaxID=4498 RepID=A0ACD5V3W5_AVESA
MDELLSPCSAFLTPSPPPQFSPADGYHDQVLEFASCEVPEQWLLGDYVVSAKSENGDYMWSAGSSSLSSDSKLSVSELPPAASLQATPRSATTTTTTTKRRGRKPGPRVEGPSVTHVEAERQRRDKLNRRFCDLRAAVPTVSRMDKASLLADATNYIAELRSRIARLEEEGRQVNSASASSRGGHAGASLHHLAADEVVEVRMAGRDEAAVRVTTTGGALHAPARLMGALRSLELLVQHACVSRVQGVTVQDVVVEVPAALQHDDGGSAIHSPLLERLRGSA